MNCKSPLRAVSVTLRHCWHERDVGEGIDGGGQVKVEARADSGSLISIVVELVNGVGRREGRDRLSFCRCCFRALRLWTRFRYSSSGKTLPEIIRSLQSKFAIYISHSFIISQVYCMCGMQENET